MELRSVNLFFGLFYESKLSRRVLKAAKYGIQKHLTCLAPLFRFKFLVDVSRFTLQDQLVAQQKHCFRVEEMQHTDWLICSVRIQDGGMTANFLRDKLSV